MIFKSPLAYLEGGLLWCLLHLCLYLVVLRNRRIFYGERRIFAYHLIAFCFCALIATATLPFAHSASAQTAIAGVLALHAIYSLSFLEVWSLAQGSYSISILNGILNRPGNTKNDIVALLAPVGEGKKVDRLSALLRLGLVLQRDRDYEITVRGRCAANFLRMLRWLTNLENAG